jgi:lysophospholipid acyltransferase (LPLAT)-like uncharacterized protein
VAGPSLTRWQLSQATAIAALGAPVIGALCRTIRWKVEGLEHYDAIVAQRRQPIFAFWHGRILAATYFWRDRNIVVMTSQNFDGEWIARIIRRFGYGTARGSTSRGARGALVQLKRDVSAGRPAAFTVDGPRGPAQRVQPGAVWLAGATGSPILPFHIEADRYWTARSWDRTQIPRPFSRAAIAIGTPFDVPDPHGDGVVAAHQEALGRILGTLEERAAALLVS